MDRFVFTVIVPLLMSACGSDGSGKREVENDGVIAATASANNGTSTMRSGKNLRADLPAGFTLYPGAKVINNTAVANQDGDGGLIIMQSNAAPADMVNFYRKQAEKAGIKLDLDIATDNGAMIAGNGPNDTTFTFNAAGTANGSAKKTNGYLTVSHGLK